MEWQLDKAVLYIEEQLPGWNWQITRINHEQQEHKIGVLLESPDGSHKVYETAKSSAYIAAFWAVKAVRGEE